MTDPNYQPPVLESEPEELNKVPILFPGCGRVDLYFVQIPLENKSQYRSH